MFGKLRNSDDPAHPLTAACQQLCTLAAITRGVTTPRSGFECALYRAPGNNPADPGQGSRVVNDNESFRSLHWHAPEDMPLPLEPANARPAPQTVAPWFRADPPLAPGSFFMYSQEPGDDWAPIDTRTRRVPRIRAGGVPHVAFVLRTRPPAHVQFFDTGAMQHPPLPETEAQHFQHTGIREYGLVAAANQGNQPFRGIGVLRRPEDLGERIRGMRTVRPLGLARLVLFDTRNGVNETILVTPMLRMHHIPDNAERNENETLCFPPARYLWSVRGLPAATDLRAEWWIYGTRRPLTELEIHHNTKDLTLRALLDLPTRCRCVAYCRQPGRRPRNAALGRNRTSATELLLVASRNDGTVSIEGRYHHEAGWQGRRCTFQLPEGTPEPSWDTFWVRPDYDSAVVLRDLPNYYTSSWSDDSLAPVASTPPSPQSSL